MVTEADKFDIDNIIIRCITGNPIKYNDPDFVKKLLTDMHIEDIDYERILKKKQNIDLQLRIDHEYLCTLIALKRYSSDIEDGNITTNSKLCLDNFDEEFNNYCRRYV